MSLVFLQKLNLDLLGNIKKIITQGLFKKVSDFFLSLSAFNQITRAKRGCKHIHSCIIMKSFKPIHQAIFFLQCIHCSHIVHARRFFDLTKKNRIIMTHNIEQKFS